MSLRSGDPEEIGGYPLESRLGSGGMGTVFLARTASGRPIAIKLIHQQFADDDEFRIRFRQEVAAARRVSGAFTAAVVDADPEGRHPWMATTYIEGATLAQRIARRGPIGGAELRSLAIGLAEALRDIHRADVVHRDLKPSNVVLSPEGPRVIDFGISRAADQQTLTMTGRVIGTPPFMSPEQLQNPRGVGPSSDVFSLGTLLVYAATGQGPFDADSPYMTAYQVVHEAPALDDVPGALRAAVEPCLAKDPAARPTVDELLVRLRDLPVELAAAESRGSRTRDTDTQHHLSTAPDGTAGAPSTPGPGDTAGATSASGGLGRRLRRRWRPVLAAVVAVAAIGGGVAVLRASTETTGGTPDGGPDGRGHTVAATGVPLPQGFRPWRQNVPPGKSRITDELRCVPRGDSAYCGGGGVIATRVRIADGRRLWTAHHPGIPVQGTHLAGVAGRDTVLGYRLPADDSGPGEVVALDTAKGEELWSARYGSQSLALSGRDADAALAGSTVLSVDAGRTRVEARAARSGKVLWTTPFPAGLDCAPVAEHGRAYLLCGSAAEVSKSEVRHATVFGVDLASGRLGEGVAVPGPLQVLGARGGQLVLAKQRVGEIGVIEYEALVRVDAARGRATTTRLAKRYGGAPALAGGRVYFTEQNGEVSAVDATTGRPAWTRQAGVEGAAGPVAGPGALYFSSASGRVAALAPRDGKLLWTTDPRTNGSADVGASPRVAFAGRVAVVSGAGNLVYAFNTAKPPRSG
ncbi:serine/threonine protein kinase [Streptomyces longispororuber]|uniref:Serine/threonine protein kinase n=1 Tax=Streptomyces longispororuber TaxID=68230 RepID=A0A919A8D4_9ACTN|nr:serine/threonine-protein kinase [Streptomyces longispororuber]GHE91829.1 serine/threonine protein kinase [Streptomyces longispororuber]